MNRIITKGVKPISVELALKTLSIAACNGGTIASWGGRTRILNSNGSVIEGYVKYISELGGLIVVSKCNVYPLTKKNTHRIIVDQIIAMEYANGLFDRTICNSYQSDYEKICPTLSEVSIQDIKLPPNIKFSPINS